MCFSCNAPWLHGTAISMIQFNYDLCSYSISDPFPLSHQYHIYTINAIHSTLCTPSPLCMWPHSSCDGLPEHGTSCPRSDVHKWACPARWVVSVTEWWSNPPFTICRDYVLLSSSVVPREAITPTPLHLLMYTPSQLPIICPLYFDSTSAWPEHVHLHPMYVKFTVCQL